MMPFADASLPPNGSPSAPAKFASDGENSEKAIGLKLCATNTPRANAQTRVPNEANEHHRRRGPNALNRSRRKNSVGVADYFLAVTSVTFAAISIGPSLIA